MCYFQPHCEEDIAVYFYKCIYQKECLWCQVPSQEGLYEWDMLAIKFFFKKVPPGSKPRARRYVRVGCNKIFKKKKKKKKKKW